MIPYFTIWAMIWFWFGVILSILTIYDNNEFYYQRKLLIRNMITGTIYGFKLSTVFIGLFFIIATSFLYVLHLVGVEGAWT